VFAATPRGEQFVPAVVGDPMGFGDALLDFARAETPSVGE